jgi:heat shock protein HspQ
MHLGDRVRHRVSGAHGVVIDRGWWGAQVRFDGEDRSWSI